MFEWHRAIQRMVDIIEREVSRGSDDRLTLENLAQKLGYSPFHVTRRFKSLTGTTFREYLGLRRLAYSVLDLRDSKTGILEIAIDHGFSSQEAYTRAFKRCFGITPRAYRKTMKPLVLQNKRITFDPYLLGLGESSVNKQELQSISTAIVTLPAHKFLHVKSINADNYCDFWAAQELIPGQGCNTISGLLDSVAGKLDGVTGKIGEFDGQIGAWFCDKSGRKGYAYGIRLPANYSGELPKQMLCEDIAQRDYVVFSHPPFDYEKIWGSVLDAMDKAMEEFDYTKVGRLPDKSSFTYQMPNPEHFGYRVYVPLR